MPSKRINVFVDLDETLIHTIGMAPYAGKETFELKGQAKEETIVWIILKMPGKPKIHKRKNVQIIPNSSINMN